MKNGGAVNLTENAQPFQTGYIKICYHRKKIG